MLINYYKGEPNSYVLSHRNGKLVRHGAGINFFYVPLNTTLAVVPLASQESQFIFNETTANFQEVSIQGSLTYRLSDPIELAKRLDFTVSPRTHPHKSEDPQQLVQRVVNSVQAHTRSEVMQRPLEQALSEVKDLSSVVFEKVANAPELRALESCWRDCISRRSKPRPRCKRRSRPITARACTNAKTRPSTTDARRRWTRSARSASPR